VSSNNIKYSFVDAYSSKNKNIGLNSTARQGFSNYSTTQGEKIYFWFYCSENAAQNNETLNVTAYWVSDLEIDD
jgi:hypothetical protein